MGPMSGMMLLLLSALPLALALPSHGSPDHLLVKTDKFAVQGTTWPNNSAARFYGNIPYAEPPVGELRFRPPVTRAPSSDIINGSWFGPSCIQYSNGEATIYTEYLRGFLISPGQTQSEDCLTLNIWTPEHIKAGEKLPVMIWIHGGGYTSGGAASQYKYGDRLAAAQNVIVVSMNYRLNIFGFPSAAALDGNNLNPGLLDQRKAVEWIYDNIYAFGGDPEQMILFGQSAGGGSVDMYTYAYPFDPLVKGFIPQSGVASDETFDATGSNFTYVASQLGCANSINNDDDDDDDAIFKCMQAANATAIISVYNKYNSSLNNNIPLSFGPAADNQTAFSNYADLRSRGLFAKLPTLYSMVNNEGSSFVDFTPSGINQTAAAEFTDSFATCPGDRAAAEKAALGVPIYRTRYFGSYPNVDTLDWMGSYHSSDLPMVFGTSDLLGPDSEREREMSRYFQDAWAAFARDPENGLEGYGWLTYDPKGKTLVELGVNGSTGAVLADGDKFDGAC